MAKQGNNAGERRGARGVGSTAWEDILKAATSLFAAQGYDRTSMRQIAGEASVDPALVRHYFKNKEALFVISMVMETRFPQHLKEILEYDGPDRVEVACERYLALWEDDELRPVLVALFKAVCTSDEVSEIAHKALFPKVPPSPQLATAISQLLGIVVTRHVLKLEPIAQVPFAELVKLAVASVETTLGSSAS